MVPAFINLAGQRFGRLLVLRRDDAVPLGQRVKWLCRCDCGGMASVLAKVLRNGMTRSCGCLRKEASRHRDLTGQTFGRWRVLQRDESLPRRHENKVRWICLCECGRTVSVLANNLVKKDRRSASRSCGCLNRTYARHGQARHRQGTVEYTLWKNAKTRCFNPNNKAYPNYGGRGITMCAEWRDSFEAFFRDVGPRPSPELSLDRIDNDKGYEPGNVRWADRVVQGKNRRRWYRKPC